MKRFLGLVLLVMLAALPMCALAGCQCVQPNEYQIGFDEATCTEPGCFVLKCADCGGTWREKAKDKLGHNYQYAQTNPALCESDGKEWFECTRCADTQYQTIPKLGHDYRVTSTVDATCGIDGKKIYTCSRLGCGAQKSETISATGNHNWEHTHTNRDDVECVAGGTAYYICSVCGDQKNESVPATGHNWNAVAATAANCTTAKVITYACSKCGDKKTETEGSKTDHSWSLTYSEPATCAADGYKTYTCGFCSQTKTDVFPATGKCTWDDWIIAANASCEKDGLKVAKCKVCGDTKKESIAATGHDWSVVGSGAATCTDAGYEERKCGRCGETKRVETQKKLGHNWKDGQVTKKPTCTEDGQASSVCERCGKAENARTLEKLGHSYGSAKVTKAATCTAEGTSETTCTTCGHKKTTTLKAKGHSYGEWKVTKEATTSAEGVQERTCSACSEKETKSIPKKDAVTPKPTATPKTTATTKPTAAPKPQNTKAPEAANKPQSTKKPEATAKPTATPKKATSKASVKQSSASLRAEEGAILIYTTSGKVNLRTGPGKKNGTAGQVAKKNTNLGNLVDAQVDSTGTVWYKVHYKGKNVWITSDYSRAVIGDMTYSDDRHVGIDSVDLSDICFSYISEAADHYGLELEMSGEASDDALTIGGASDFVEYIELTGEGYALYGVEIGDKLKTLENAMKKNGLYCVSKGGSIYTYKRPLQPYSMCVNDEGFDSYIEVVLDSSKCVESISWNAYTE